MNELVHDRIPPANLEAEQALLGALLVDADLGKLLVDRVEHSDFYAPSHGLLFRAIASVIQRGERADKIAVCEELATRKLLEKAGGPSYLSKLMDTVQTCESATYYAKLVREKSVLRDLIAAGSKISELGYNGEEDLSEALSQAERELQSATKRYTSDRPAVDVAENLVALWRVIDAKKQDAQATPWPSLDHITGGFLPGELITWAAGPKIGKSGVVLNLADFTAKHYGNVAFFALEMGVESTVQRLLALYSHVPVRKLRLAEVAESEWGALSAASGRVSHRPIFIEGRPKSVRDIRGFVQRLERDRGPVRAVVIDHAGFVSDVMQRSERSSKHETLDAVYNALLEIAQEFNCVMHVVQHVNREGMRGEPNLSQIRDGGNIEGYSNAIIFPYRPHANEPRADATEQRIGKFIIGANRAGLSGEVAMKYIGYRHLWLEESQPAPWFEYGEAGAA